MPLSPLTITRMNNGEPIIYPSPAWWETGVTFNAAAVFLPPVEENRLLVRALLPMIPEDDTHLKDGIVAIHYRARPENDPGSDFGRSFIGLALFTPDLLPLYRYTEPVLWPSPDPVWYDSLGVEDPRITRLEGKFYMVYAGVRADSQTTYKVSLCMAVSEDLLHWQKLGPISGEINTFNNKDGVLFPERIDGRFFLLHRPYQNEQPPSERAIRIAESASLMGPWTDRGEVLRAFSDSHRLTSWPGAGSVPIPLGDKRYLMIYHTGHMLDAERREYDLDAAILDFKAFDPAGPGSLVTARLEHLMVPKSPAELRSHSRLQVANVLFACGSYEVGDVIRIVYGGADTYTLAAELNRAQLLAALAQSGTGNPFL